MSKSIAGRSRYIGKTLVALVPWITSMYILYRLEYGEIWSTATPHRGKLTVVILLVGMTLSFVTYSRLFDRNK